MSKARFILVALICASPATLWDGPLVQGVVAGIVAVILAIIARSLHPGETEFLVSTVGPIAIVAAVPALWMVIQVLPLKGLAHPIWASVETGLGHPVVGTISVDLGASVIALGRYVCMAAVMLGSAAIAVDRKRAKWILFALLGAAAASALIFLVDELFYSGTGLTLFQKAQTLDCAALGVIFASAACIRTVERYEASRVRSMQSFMYTFLASSAALASCAAALFFDRTREVATATGYGFVAFACMLIMRRFRLGAWYASMIAATAICLGVVLLGMHQTERAKSPLLAFATAPTSISEHLLENAPIVGTGAGTFASLLPIYRELDDAQNSPVASSAAAAVAIELGQPILWLIVAAIVTLAIILLRASLRRGRDSFYSSMGGSCLIVLIFLAFINAGLVRAPTALVAAAALGLALAQSRSRTIKR